MRKGCWAAVLATMGLAGCGSNTESIDAHIPDAGATDRGVDGSSADAWGSDRGTDGGPGDAQTSDRGTDGGPGDAGTDAHPDIVRVIEVPGRDPGTGWADSYSVDNQCYCDSTYDHGIGTIEITTPVGVRTVRAICDAIGPGPGSHPPGEEPRPTYNDIQCGNGPANDAGDEDDCPGRVDIGREGCGHIGPRWDLSVLE